MRRRKENDARMTAMAVVFLLCLGGVCTKLVIIQGIEAHRYIEIANKQRDSIIKVSPRRGTIFDRDGEILAISEDVTTVYATPYQIKKPHSTARKIAEVLGQDEKDVEKKLRARCGFIYIARKIDNRIAEKLRKMNLEGIGFIPETTRFYPQGSIASQVIGLCDMDMQGQSGLELYYDKLLGGRQGEIILEKDASGSPIPGTEKVIKKATDGEDIQLTLDADIQAYLENSLEAAVEKYSAKAATAFVMDCNTGDIYAMASYPDFDPNDRTNLDPASMRNRAITDVYEPGSALKIVTAVAALESGVVTPDTIVHVPTQIKVWDKVFKDAEPVPERDITFTRVISESSNVGTIEVALKTGASRLAEYLSRFGLGHKTGVDFPGEVGGIVPPLREWSGTSVATISIGQGVSVTPLQLGCVAGTIANGGRRIFPHFIKAKVTNNGIRDMGYGGLGDQILSRDTSPLMTAILEQVTSPGGTGTRAATKFYRVAGKTGTAAKPKEGASGYSSNYMATFVGYAPAEKPRLVALVVLDEPQPIWGGHTAAPVFSQIMSFSLQHLEVPPSVQQAPKAEPAKSSARD